MRWTFDLDAGAFYFPLTDEAVSEQRELAPGLIVDVDANGAAVGVEYLLQASDLGAGVAELIDLVGEEAAKAIAFVVTNPPLPRQSAAVSRPPGRIVVPTGERTFDLISA
jgi:uncharacterized protein YuzE